MCQLQEKFSSDQLAVSVVRDILIQTSVLKSINIFQIPFMLIYREHCPDGLNFFSVINYGELPVRIAMV